MIFKKNSEIAGRLTGIEENGTSTLLIFSFVKTVEIPASAIPREELVQLIGHRIGIINIDNCYRVREIGGKK
jgi:hypothetical protein